MSLCLCVGEVCENDADYYQEEKAPLSGLWQVSCEHTGVKHFEIGWLAQNILYMWCIDALRCVK